MATQISAVDAGEFSLPTATLDDVLNAAREQAALQRFHESCEELKRVGRALQRRALKCGNADLSSSLSARGDGYLNLTTLSKAAMLRASMLKGQVQ